MERKTEKDYLGHSPQSKSRLMKCHLFSKMNISTQNPKMLMILDCRILHRARVLIETIFPEKFPQKLPHQQFSDSVCNRNVKPS